MPGRVPFVVPPTATKSSFLSNLVIREIWARAESSLANAQRLIVIGYSVPPEDQVVGGMLAETLGGRHTEVVIVDRCPEVVADRLERLGVSSSAVRFCGESCVEEFTDWYLNDQATHVVDALRKWACSVDLNPEDVQAQMRVDWGKCWRTSCMHSAPHGHEGSVNTDGIAVCGNGTDLLVPLLERAPRQINRQQVPTLLHQLCNAPQLRRLLVQTTDKRFFPVIRYTVSPPNTDASGSLVDLTLVPSGHPR